MEQLSFFEKTIKVVNKYGILNVLKTIVLVGLFLFVVVYVPSMTKRYIEETTLIALRQSNIDKEKEHSDDIERRRSIQPQVYQVLESLIESTMADRAYIVELHNGSQNIGSVPFLHGTVTYEKTRDGVDEFEEEFQNISLSKYVFSSYIHTNFTFIGTNDEMREIDKKLATKLEIGNVKYVGITTLHNGSNEWGWLGISYLDADKIPSNEVILKNLMITSQSISKIFSNGSK